MFEGQKVTFCPMDKKIELMEAMNDDIFNSTTPVAKSFFAGIQHAEKITIEGEEGNKVIRLEYQGAYGMVTEEIALAELCRKNVSDKELIKALKKLTVHLHAA